MYKSGTPIAVYLGEDRQLYLNRPAKYLFEFPARIINGDGGKTIIYITAIPYNFDNKTILAPPGYIIKGINSSDKN